jgi:sugar transferase (PEP-CTERM/EpsH1 system associated)
LKILFIVPYVPNHIRVRPYNLIRNLADRGHNLTVMTLWTNEEDKISLGQLKNYSHEIYAVHLSRWRSFYNSLSALPTYKPLQSTYCWHPNLAKRVESIAYPGDGRPAFDVIHIEHMRGVRYGLRLKTQQPNSHSPTPLIWDSVDSIGHLFRQASLQSKKVFGRWMARFELKRTERYEYRMIDQFDRVLVTSEADKKAFLSYKANRKRKSDNLVILPNGVDTSYFKPNPSVSREPATLVVSGKMSYHANVTMVMHLIEEIMPLVWATRDDTKVWIVGKDPPKSIQTMAHDSRIKVTGTVDDIRPYLHRATIAVAPVPYGAGIQNKVLEAMACATPIIASTQAISALNVSPGKELLTAEEPVKYAGMILNLMDNKDLQNRIGQAGRDFVEKHHQWSGIASRLEKIYQQAIVGD